MAYTDGLYIISNAATSVQTETGAANIVDHVIPCNATILQFGALITEVMTDHTVQPVISLAKKTGIGATATTLVSLTLGKHAISSLKKGDGVKEAQTAIVADTELLDDDTVIAFPGSFPITVQAGDVLSFQANVASLSVGGAYIPFAILRLDGTVDARRTTTWTATVARALATAV